MSPPLRLAREPIVHFLVAGALIFSAFALLRGPASDAGDERTIIVDRRALLTFMQYRANAFDPETFSAALDTMTEIELDALISAYVDEETLYREARTLGLEESDYIMRQRMVQKMSFLLGDVADNGRPVDEADLRAYFERHREAYTVEPSTTFTHVFFNSERRGPDEARAAAESTRRTLNEARALFNDATDKGDNFPFLRHYVERTYDFVASHFGTEFAARLRELPAAETEWQGPLRSAYGEHIVLVTSKRERRYPPLDEVRGDVERDYLEERSEAALREITRSLRDRYEVVVGDVRAPDDRESP